MPTPFICAFSTPKATSCFTATSPATARFVRKRGQLLAHIQNTFHQYNLPRPPGLLIYKSQRAPVPDAFQDPIVRKGVEAALA